MSFMDNFGEKWAEDAGEPADAVESEEEVISEEVIEPEDAETPEEVDEPDAAPVEADKKPHTVPYSEMKKERDKRQELERRLAEVQQPKEPVRIPDAYERPDEFGQHFQGQVEQVRWESRAEISGIRAETKYGKETVDAAIEWAQERRLSDPTLENRVYRSASPVEAVVQEYQQARTLETLAGRTFEEAARDWAEKQGLAVSPGAKPSPKPSHPTPPRSLASRPGQGGSNQGSGDPFEGIFSSDKMGLSK